ncbi:Ba137 [Baboon cytomegalovirus]|nr:Ba137 [Baboon cytomegalovirus]
MGAQCCKRICCFFGSPTREPLRDTMGRQVCLRSFADLDNTSSEDEENLDLLSITSEVSLTAQDPVVAEPRPKKKKKKKDYKERQLTLALMQDEGGYHSPARATRTMRPKTSSNASSSSSSRLLSRPPTPKHPRTRRISPTDASVY